MTHRTNDNGVVVIGIDFGTTFTGVAYSYIRLDDRGLGDTDPEPVTLWPVSADEAPNFDSPKVPSQIAYQGENIIWGQLALDEQEPIRWFKLLLLDEKHLQPHLRNSDHLRQARKLIDQSGRDVVTVISDYLSQLWKHVLEVIARARGQRFLSANPLHVVVTVPAIWQDIPIQRMERALDKAGILSKRPGCPDTTHTFISEPEAAALASIHGHRRYDALEIGQTFVIADLGGGTVDLISFKVKSTRPELILEEAVEGEGGLCGATFLDQAFLVCLQKKIRRKKLQEKNLKSWQQMHELERKRITDALWERGIKRKYYNGQPEQRIDLGAQGNRRPYVVLDADDLDNIFNSVYNNISNLIHGQVQAILKKTGNLPEFIIMNGGFGRCEYIYRKLLEKYESHIEILLEANTKPWTAIARGAVLSGAAHVKNRVHIQSHISRFSYGWVKKEEFDHRVHDIEDHDTDELTGYSIARDQMEWIILRGDSVKTLSTQVYEYERYFEVDEVGFVSFSEPIYRSRLKCPPKRLAENEAQEGSLSKNIEAAEFRKHVIIDMKTPVPVEQLPRRGDAEHPHRLLIYRVEVNISGASLIIKATAGGRNIGEKTIYGLAEH
ncbi:hypothetical protein NUW58_g4053 [Xylaria curta]|uniref:Uncharacterized protein n=1 Tax=Xylaria curta TaxID=42375 RepID=A0ACC1P841_9PEZI|nr:hypothetical protein NUW58_g4053 [Xylaria curta]